ncbi:DUF2993 domain-containing protein [Microbacterium sp. cx-55]|uniref:LmeA family phospholipid-binding protein n=1 Tax=Microbacterium sp. cx-55 TaxID=2875948 RepID=UPI001CBEB09D|nr:DUF2993 domain-containing protein [Microbacterium sp. cx-55]MBZ4488504.1 DUF2993 domain-containing protein [Microbacterium sp. cx-55]UGB36090.1 DUF2993 domain-containing protein [Microbacterium sp. cx-55]
MSADTQPTEPFPSEWREQPVARRRHRRWPWLVAILVVLALVVAAFFAGEWIARDLITKGVQQQVVSRLALPADQEVDVDIPGSVLFQLAAGTIDEVRLSSDDVTVGDVSGDISVDLRQVKIWDGPTMADGAATVTLDEQQVRSLLATVDGLPAESVGLAAPNVTASTELSLFGAAIPLQIALTPSAADGDLVLSPAALQLAGADITADGVRERFGALADPLLQGWRVCIAQYLPAGVPLQAVRVEGSVLVADFAVDGTLLTDAGQRAKGTCA